LIDFLVSEETQELIGNYGVKDYGQALFTPAPGMNPELHLQLQLPKQGPEKVPEQLPQTYPQVIP
jgi:hypothetical protein